MANDSILTGTKKILGISEQDTSFDFDVMTHINSVFSTLQQLGVGPAEGYMIEDASDEWFDYIEDNNSYNMIKTYMYLKVRMAFDPPATSFHINAMQEQIREHEVRISTNREWLLDPVDPMTIVEEEVDDGVHYHYHSY